MAEDAKRALTDVNKYDGKKIRVSFAKKKLKEKKKGGKAEMLLPRELSRFQSTNIHLLSKQSAA